jgi:hypothetical protein
MIADGLLLSVCVMTCNRVEMLEDSLRPPYLLAWFCVRGFRQLRFRSLSLVVSLHV